MESSRPRQSKPMMGTKLPLSSAVMVSRVTPLAQSRPAAMFQA